MQSLLTILLLLAPVVCAQQAELAEESQRGRQLMAQGKFAEAAEVYRELVQALPTNPGLLVNLGMAHHLAGQSAQAVPEFEAALRIQPGIVPALLFLGASLIEIGEPSKAIPPLEQVVSAQPEMAQARQLLGDALAQTGHLHQAVPHYRRWSALDPASARAWFALATAYETLAREAFETLGRKYPETAYMLALVGEVRLSQKQHRSAFYLYRKALERRPDMKGLHARVARVYRETGHPDWATREDAIEATIPAPDCDVHRLECDFRTGKFLSVAGGSGDSAEALYWRSRAYNVLALEARDRLAALPPSLESHQLLADLHTNQDRHLEAAKQWRAALKLAPGDTGLETDLAISLYRGRDYETAVSILEPLLKRQPQSAEINYYLGDSLLNMQQPEKAVPYLSLAVQKRPDFLPGRSSLGRAYLQLRRGAEAAPHLKAALPLDQDGSLHFQLARAYQMSGDTVAAKQMLAQYQEIRKANEAERKELESEARITPP